MSHIYIRSSPSSPGSAGGRYRWGVPSLSSAGSAAVRSSRPQLRNVPECPKMSHIYIRSSPSSPRGAGGRYRWGVPLPQQRGIRCRPKQPPPATKCPRMSQNVPHIYKELSLFPPRSRGEDTDGGSPLSAARDPLPSEAAAPSYEMSHFVPKCPTYIYKDTHSPGPFESYTFGALCYT